MKKLLKLFICIFCILVLASCSNEHPDELFPNKVELELCSFDNYQLNVDDLGYQLDTFTFETDNSLIADITSEGYITTYGEGEVSIYAESILNSDFNTEIELQVVKGIKVDYIDVGQGDAILISLPNGEVMMIDAGRGLYYDEQAGLENIYETFQKRGIGKIDYLVMTHNHGDHYGFVPNIIRDYEVENIYASGSMRSTYEFLNIMQSIKLAAIPYNIVSVGDYLINEEDLTAQVVGVQLDLDEDNGGDPNFQSVMIKIKYKETAYMFTGDAGYKKGDCEWIALNSGIDLTADVLKVGHHGSMYSSSVEFLNAVKPKIAVITTSKTTETGHPHNQALNRINNVGAVIYQSAKHGTITISSTGYRIYIQTEKQD
ncbi:MAG: MBL fold metallo-hydrolase [Bacilli bacterium]|nr:MBL fold metallo-hydrolase [Bacilli bacterium]